jgi:hypothetical protein
MVALNEHQSRLWRRMLQSIEDFRQGNLKYYDFVGILEGALDAGEFREKGLVEKWYDFWTPLESVRAQKGNSVTVGEVSKYVSAMEAFLKSIPLEE